jgi:outer membrane protein OmpA-like peptidoglycan-associated protein
MTFKSRARGVAGAKPATSDAGSGGTSPGGMPRFLSRRRNAEPVPGAPLSVAENQRSGVPAFVPRALPAATAPLGLPGDRHELEADRAAQLVRAATTSEPASVAGAPPPRGSPPVAPTHGPAALLGKQGRALDGATRSFMEQRFGADFAHVRVHTDGQAAQLNRDLRANAFTHGSDIFYGAGHGPGRDELTAHELAHVVQQAGGSRDGSAIPLTARAGPVPIQCSFAATYMIPGSASLFEIDLQTREGALAAPPTKSGLDGYLRFVPGIGEPNSSVIGIWQVNSTIDASGADVNAASMPAAQAPRGALGDPGLRTEEDPLRGIEGGFKTDVLHRPNAASPGVPAGSALSPRYPWGAAAPGTVGFGGTTQQPASRGGGIGANPLGQAAGYKRSDDPADIRTASLYDFPGTSSPTDVITWTFESAAIGEDTMVTYGAVNWGFTVDAGHVTNEHLQVEAGTSATFDEALERHRDFYVHEPVTFYFDFNDDVLNATEEAKIDTFLAYLTRNPDVELALEGFADQVGGASQYNRDLSLRRAHAVEAALLAKGIAAARINGIIIGHGASTAATADAGTGDEGGDAAVGADQSREANRWANRRVILTFSHVPAVP